MNRLASMGLIGGGQMGEALVRGIVQANIIEPTKIVVAEPDEKRGSYLEKQYSITLSRKPGELCEACSTIILAVKPQVIDKVLEEYREFITKKHLIISIAAGVSLQSISGKLAANVPVIRVMPNTPALVLAGASAFSANRAATGADRAVVQSILEAIGTTVELPEEYLDAVTGLSGSGPGYIFTFIEAMIDGGVREGLPRDIAEKLTLQTFLGTARLALESGEHPAVLKGRVTSPGGTTITVLHVLERSGIRGAIMSAVSAAADRSRQLS